MRKSILIIEGDASTSATIANALFKAEYMCVQAQSLPEALSCVEHGGFDLAVLDAALVSPQRADPFALLRAKGQFPVVVTAARGNRDGVIALLDAGAEDYLFLPFEAQDLVDRIDLLLRRKSEPRQCAPLRYKDLALDPVLFTVTLCDQQLNLTRQEFKILELMLSFPPGRVFSKQDFFNYAWDNSYVGADKTINVHICNLRRKFKAITSEEYIETIWGFGFRLA